jgi:hypothetical protein
MQQPRRHSEAIRKSYLKASNMYNNHSLIAIQKASVFQHRHRLVKHLLHLDETGHYFGDPIELAKVETRVGGTSEIKAVQAGGNIFFFIINLDGRYEMIRFKELRELARSRAPETDKESMASTGKGYSEFAGSSEAPKTSETTVVP